jgi:hypothetical protein
MNSAIPKAEAGPRNQIQLTLAATPRYAENTDRPFSLSPHVVQQNRCIRLPAPRLFGRIEREGGHEDNDTAAD